MFVSTSVLDKESTTTGVLSSYVSVCIKGKNHVLEKIKLNRTKKLVTSPQETVTLSSTCAFHLPAAGTQVTFLGARAHTNIHTIVEYQAETVKKAIPLTNVVKVSLKNVNSGDITCVDLSSVQLSLSIGDKVLLNNRKGGVNIKNGILKATVVRVCETSLLLVSLQKPSSDYGDAHPVKFQAFPEVFSIRVSKSKACRVLVPVNAFLSRTYTLMCTTLTLFRYLPLEKQLFPLHLSPSTINQQRLREIKYPRLIKASKFLRRM